MLASAATSNRILSISPVASSLGSTKLKRLDAAASTNGMPKFANPPVLPSCCSAEPSPARKPTMFSAVSRLKLSSSAMLTSRAASLSEALVTAGTCVSCAGTPVSGVRAKWIEKRFSWSSYSATCGGVLSSGLKFATMATSAGFQSSLAPVRGFSSPGRTFTGKSILACEAASSTAGVK